MKGITETLHSLEKSYSFYYMDSYTACYLIVLYLHPRILVQLSQLVEENEAAKKRETEFKDTCRKESDRMKKEIR